MDAVNRRVALEALLGAALETSEGSVMKQYILLTPQVGAGAAGTGGLA